MLDPVGSLTEPTAGISIVMIISESEPGIVVGPDGTVPAPTWVCCPIGRYISSPCPTTLTNPSVVATMVNPVFATSVVNRVPCAITLADGVSIW